MLISLLAVALLVVSGGLLLGITGCLEEEQDAPPFEIQEGDMVVPVTRQGVSEADSGTIYLVISPSSEEDLAANSPQSLREQFYKEEQQRTPQNQLPLPPASAGNTLWPASSGNKLWNAQQELWHAWYSAQYGANHTAGRGGLNLITNFAPEAMRFYIAMGALAFWKCAIQEKENPMACAQWWQQMKDPIGHIAFASFIMTSRSLTHYLSPPSRLASGRLPIRWLPPGMISYLGMAAGSFVSSLVDPFLRNQSVRHIASRMFDDRSKWTPDDHRNYEAAWNQAYSEFAYSMSTQAPHITALILSAIASHMTQREILKIAQKISERTGEPIKNIKKWYKINSAKLSLTGKGLKLTGKIIKSIGPQKIAGFALFLAWDEFLAAPITRFWELNRSTRDMHEQEQNLIEILSEAYPSVDRHAANVRIKDFLDDNIYNSDYFEAQRAAYLFTRSDASLEAVEGSLGCDGFEGICDLLEEEGGAFNRKHLLRETPLRHHQRLAEARVPQSVTQLPVILHTNYADFLQSPLSDGHLREQEQDALLKALDSYEKSASRYFYKLNEPIEMLIQNWKEFFEPYSTRLSQTEKLYKDIILQSAGLASVFNDASRQLNGSERSRRSQLILATYHLGLNDLIRGAERSPQDTRPLMSLAQEGVDISMPILSENTTMINELDRWIGSQCDEQRWWPSILNFLGNGECHKEEMINYINLGLDLGVGLSKIREFSRRDFEAHIAAYYLGIQPLVLSGFTQEETPQLEAMIDLLESVERDKPEDIALYVFQANFGYATIEGYEIIEQDDIYQFFREREEAFANMKEGACEDGNFGCLRIQRDCSDLSSTECIRYMYFQDQENMRTRAQSQQGQIARIQRERGVFNLQPVTSNQSLYFQEPHSYKGIKYASTTEEILIHMVCGDSLDELEHNVASKRTLSHLTFVSPRIFEEKPAFCSRLRSVHHSFEFQWH